MLRWLTAGESHGPALVATIEGLPAGVEVTTAGRRRRPGPPPARLRPRRPDEVRAGRGRVPRGRAARRDDGVAGRDPDRQHRVAQVADRDVARPGRRRGATPPSDDVNAEKEVARNRPLTRPRPGHADLVGMQKYGFEDARPVLERASARETAARVALGEVAARFLEQAYGIRLVSHTVAIGTAGVGRRTPRCRPPTTSQRSTPTRCAPSTPAGSAAMVAEVDAAKKDGDTLGGVVEVVAYGLPPGLGSHVHWDRRLDAQARGRADGHPGDQGRRGRRRLPHRGPPRLGRPRRDGARRRRRHPPPHRPRRRHRGRHVDR